jgi:hypothetical protein
MALRDRLDVRTCDQVNLFELKRRIGVNEDITHESDCPCSVPRTAVPN